MKPINPLPAMAEWYAKNCQMVVAPKPSQLLESKPIRTPVTELDAKAIKAIGNVTYCVGIPAKRFARQIQGVVELTASQREYVWGIVWRYRRQIKDAELVEHARQTNGEK